LNKITFKTAAVILLLTGLISYSTDWKFGGDIKVVVLILILAVIAYSWSWTYTPEGRLDYRAALSLHLLTFSFTIKPDRELDFGIKMPVNLLFALSALAPKDKMERTEDISIEHSGLSIPARIYWPVSNNTNQLPLLVYYHGGGFMMGDLDLFDAIARSLAASTRAIVVSVDYRLAPRHPFPAAVEDAYVALLWSSENAVRLGANPDQLMIAGDSAGGNLAATVSLRARDQNGPKVAAQLLYYPAADLSGEDSPGGTVAGEEWAGKLRFQNGYVFTTESLCGFRNAYCGHVEDARVAEVSPALAENMSGLPPTLLVTAGFDPLTDGATLYGNRLQQAGGALTHEHYPEMIHGFLSVNAFPQRRDSLNRTANFVQNLFSAVSPAS